MNLYIFRIAEFLMKNLLYKIWSAVCELAPEDRQIIEFRCRAERKIRSFGNLANMKIEDFLNY